MPIFEILEMTNTLRRAIIKQESNAEMKKKALDAGLVTLRQSALERLKEGLTTVEEVVNTSIKDEV
jgi:type IV pilus assembly protein PilB